MTRFLRRVVVKQRMADSWALSRAATPENRSRIIPATTSSGGRVAIACNARPVSA